ncbi:hypothetical protein F8M41_018168 [Gigaspora margarita]|uniref:F-box domain-containing protein n=1 Tax=Gigaspora margarita TaxID=4874 RepID=A0A8H4ELF3_GIGMA|nr:hypothetical protein F8M41_018168 [Gigaspora margarita]
MFIGDMPELMEIILNNLNNEFYSLYSCALVSRHCKQCYKISALNLYEFYSYYEPQFYHAFICIIKSQEQLRQFSLSGEYVPTEFHGIISALESQNNSLQEIIIEFCKLSTEFKVLMNCKNLEILRIKHCDNLKILEASLNTLEVFNNLIDALDIVQILQKSGTLLQRLILVSEYEPKIWEEPLLFETLKSFCPNITYLCITVAGFSTQFLELIINLQKLQFLTLRSVELIQDIKVLTEMVVQFAKLLPLTLQYLDLCYSWMESFIDILLNNCYAPIKYLLIDWLYDDLKVKALTEFFIRKKSLNYICIRENLDDNIKKEVEEYVTLMPYERIVVNC